MSERVCPNCGKFVPQSTSQCSCGFSWDEGEVPAPDIVRSAVQRRMGGPEREPVFSMPDRTTPRPAVESPGHAASGRHDDAESTRATSAAAAFPNLGSFSEPARTARRSPPQPRAAATPVRPSAPAVAAGEGSRGRPGQSPAQVLSDSVQPQRGLLMDCPACGVRISKRASRCPKCETAPWAFCLICASRILANSESCSECGDPQPFMTPPPQEAR